ncbi:MAG: hypothetical protein JSV89_05340 [Spirochaetaceae bacterium]|nr:MAG: hypothetical protein JSV89_05340 [Spirochaetaceae bacterium]
MKPTPVDLKLNLSARSELSLRSGDSVIVQVIKRLTESKWAVGIRGRVLPAVSKVELAPGQRLRAVVAVRHGQIILKISDQPANPIQELISRQGLQPNQMLESIVTSLLRSGLSVTPERLQQVRQLLEKLKLDPKKFARLSAVILDKGIDPRSRGLDQLLPILGYGERESGERRGGNRQMPRDPERFAEQLCEEIGHSAGGEGNSLQVFNHLQGSDYTWIIVPIDYSYEGSGRVYGTIRLRYRVGQQQVDRIIVVARNESGGKWSFVLQAGGEPELIIFTDPLDKRRKAKSELDVLLLKLQNLGVKTDDTIREDRYFDGFDLPWEELSYRNVDTVH